MLVSYPALFYFEDSKDGGGFSIFFADLTGATQGDSIPQAIEMASEYLGIYLSELIESQQEIPKPSSINDLSLIKNLPFNDYSYNQEKSFISMVNVNVADYLGDYEPVKKTLTIPKWADNLGKELKLNFSKTLTDAIAQKKLDNDL